MRTLLLLLAAASAAKPTAALAADDPLTFAALDMDRSGDVTRAEFDRAVRPMFAEIDRDGSGFVTKSEFRSFAMRKMMSGDRPALMKGPRPKLKFDRNGDMGFAAFADGLWQAQFAPRDVNGDGRLDSSEFARKVG